MGWWAGVGLGQGWRTFQTLLARNEPGLGRIEHEAIWTCELPWQ